MRIIKEKCPICGDQFIDGIGRLMPNHKQIKVELTGGHTTYLAYCKKHNLSDEELKELTALTLDYVSSETNQGFYKTLEFVRKR